MQLSLALEDADFVMERCTFTHEATGVEAEVCQDIASRQAFGIHKYGRTVADNPLTHKQWLQHAYEECLDQAIYLKRAMREL